MNNKMPHIVQYQGSKRILAPQILKYMPLKFERLIEPFAGMAAISIASAYENRTQKFWINDINKPLVDLLQMVIEEPEKLIESYYNIWQQQFFYNENHVQHYYNIRDNFNEGNQNPANMLYLLARCVKGSVRYGKSGNFNQSPDKRRHGITPKNLERNIKAVSSLLKGKTTFTSIDYKNVLNMAKSGDIVYMDPPYQGVSNTRDNRYFSGVKFDEFVNAIEMLNNKNIDYLISYDGFCGDKGYGLDLPEKLHCKKILLNAGLSSQSILLGRKDTTFEALYISEKLIPVFAHIPEQLTLLEAFA